MTDDGETPITSIRFPDDQVAELDRLVPGEYPDRSTAIRTATGEMVLDWRMTEGRVDSIDRFIADYRETDGALRDAVFAALTDIELEENRNGYMTAARLERGADRFYGTGTDRGAAVTDLVDTVYDEITDRAVNRYGFDME